MSFEQGGSRFVVPKGLLSFVLRLSTMKNSLSCELVVLESLLPKSTFDFCLSTLDDEKNSSLT